jgi:hypothetical protein
MSISPPQCSGSDAANHAASPVAIREETRDARIKYKRTRTATILMPNRKPNGWGNRFRLLEDPISPPIWWVVFPIITRRLKKVENSNEKRSMVKTGTCIANSSFAHFNPRALVRQTARPVSMHQANSPIESMPAIPAATWRRPGNTYYSPYLRLTALY